MNNQLSKEYIALIIFGATGDLTKRKLMPAIYQLQHDNQLTSHLKIVGFARRPWNNEIMCENFWQGVSEFARKQPVEIEERERLLENSIYIQSSFEESEGYTRLKKIIKDENTTGVIFYLATPPEEYLEIVRRLGENHLTKISKQTRIVIEKPYGRDLTSALEIESELHKYFDEDQIFRIDHYLGKETVQNILVFRFANGIFEPLWNNHYIDHIQITVAETIGVGTRAGYYDHSGIIRDMFANHLLQLLALTAMEVPFAFNANSVRDEKMKVLRSLRLLINNSVIENTFRAQYGPGRSEEGVLPGYLHEPGVNKFSITETFLAIKVNIDNWRWAGVPFYIRCGKRLPIRATEIAIHFKQIPLSLFDWRNMAGDAPNSLILRLQPNEGISLTFGAKLPGHKNQIAPVEMDFFYEKAFGNEPPEAYERLLLDLILGDATLFTRTDEVLEQWEFTQSILDAWSKYPVKKLPQYPSGSWGPAGADQFIKKDNRLWRKPV